MSIMNKRWQFAYLVLFECLIENGRHFEEFSCGHLFQVWDRVNKFGKFSALTIARERFPNFTGSQTSKTDRAKIIQNGGRSRSNTQITPGKQTSIFYS